MIEIDRRIVESYPKFSKDIYWSMDRTLYKICKFDLSTLNRINFLKYVYGLENVPGLNLPLSLLYDDEIYGYEMAYINGSCNIDEYISVSNKDKDVRKIISSIFEALKEIHKYFIFIDVRNSNILVKDNSAIFIDWDFGIIKGTEDYARFYYRVLTRKYIGTVLEDLAKAFISALSLLYHCDIELFMTTHNLLDLQSLLESINADKEIIHCVKLFTGLYVYDERVKDFDFTNMFLNVNLPTKKEKELIRERIRHIRK